MQMMGRVTFVYSELERKGEVIGALFDGRDEAVDVSVDSVREVSTRQSTRSRADRPP
jgi:hypothetical protein